MGIGRQGVWIGGIRRGRMKKEEVGRIGEGLGVRRGGPRCD